MTKTRVFGPVGVRGLGAICGFISLLSAQAYAHWEEEADELPDWAQRGRIIFTRLDDTDLPPECKDWRPVIHLHGARASGARVAMRKALRIPTSLRLEATMFFGDDRAVKKIKQRAPHGWREHSWYWQYNWWIRDPLFLQAALIKRDGARMIEYWGNSMTEREAGNPLHPLMRRMRKEISTAVLTPHDPSKPDNPFYPAFPYTPFDDTNFGAKEPFEYYPVFGHLSMLWYDNPVFWADSSEHSQKIWKEHFRNVFGHEIADPASHPSELVRREWTKFWADAYGDYLDDYYKFHQENVLESAVPETTTALNGKRHLTVGWNTSIVSTPWGAQALYLFSKHKCCDFPGLLVEYYPMFTQGKIAPLIKFSMASMHGRPTGGPTNNPLWEAEALATNGANAYSGLNPRVKAWIQFQYDNRPLFTNALPDNRVAILYNIRTGLVTETLVNAYELACQLDEIGIPYDAITEEDLFDAKDRRTPSRFVLNYRTLLVPGGEFDDREQGDASLPGEREALEQYARRGGHLVVVGDVLVRSGRLMALDLASAREPNLLPFEHFVRPARPVPPDAEDTTREYKLGKGMVTVCDDQILTNARLSKILEPGLSTTYRVLDPKGGLVVANALRQPKAGDARIIGLVNYSGELQTNVTVVLPKGLEFKGAAAVSPDGYAQPLEAGKTSDQPSVTVPELYQYTAVILGPKKVVEAAMATVQPKLVELVKVREPLRKPEPPPWNAIRPEDVPAAQRLSRIRAGTNDSGAIIALDALGPRRAKTGEPIRLTLKVLDTGTHYIETATLEYWRLHFVNIANGREIRTEPPGAKEPIDGVGLQLLDGDKLSPMPYKAKELDGKTLVGEVRIDEPGAYRVYVDYLFNNVFLQGDAGPRVEPAFLGDRPEAGWGYAGRPLKKLYIRHKLPTMVIRVE